MRVDKIWGIAWYVFKSKGMSIFLLKIYSYNLTRWLYLKVDILDKKAFKTYTHKDLHTRIKHQTFLNKKANF